MDTNPEETSKPPLATPLVPQEPAHREHTGHIEPDLPRVRTYAEDLSEEIKKKGATLTTMVGAERERSARMAAEIGLSELGENAPEEKSGLSWRAILLGGGIALMVILGVGAVGAAVLYRTTGSEQITLDPSIIFPNKVKEIKALSSFRDIVDALGTEREASTLSLGEVQKYVITLDGATTSPQTLLQKMNVPDDVVREARLVMIGTHAFNHVQPFIIIQISQYDRAFSAMLKWEPEIGRSLGKFFRPIGAGAPPTMQFTDTVFQNIDVRQSQNQWPIIYAFPRRDILVITTNTATLNEIVTRLNAETSQSQSQ